jgi:hypothetical protein
MIQRVRIPFLKLQQHQQFDFPVGMQKVILISFTPLFLLILIDLFDSSDGSAIGKSLSID